MMVISNGEKSSSTLNMNNSIEKIPIIVHISDGWFEIIEGTAEMPLANRNVSFHESSCCQWSCINHISHTLSYNLVIFQKILNFPQILWDCGIQSFIFSHVSKRDRIKRYENLQSIETPSPNQIGQQRQTNVIEKVFQDIRHLSSDWFPFRDCPKRDRFYYPRYL